MRDENFILSSAQSSSSGAAQNNPSYGLARRPGMKAAPNSTTASPDPDFAARQAKALLVHARLCAEYGAPFPFFSTKDPLSELVSALLSHRTKNADSHRAYQELHATLPTWEAVRDAPTPVVQHAIRACTWPEQKAPRIQAVLREISQRCGTDAPCALDFLAAMPVAEARAWLESLPGVGPKTSAATLLFSTLRIPAMPVDSHHHRVAPTPGPHRAENHGKRGAQATGRFFAGRLGCPAGVRPPRSLHVPRAKVLLLQLARLPPLRSTRPVPVRAGTG